MVQPQLPTSPDDVEHFKLMLAGAGALIGLFVGIICWLIKRDIGKIDGQLQELTKNAQREADDFDRHERQAIAKFGKLETAITELRGEFKAMQKVCDERNTGGTHR